MKKKFTKHRMGEQLILRKVKDGWIMSQQINYSFPSMELAKEFAEMRGIEFREPIVDDVGNITITT